MLVFKQLFTFLKARCSIDLPLKLACGVKDIKISLEKAADI
jgi:hypothetical protein